MLNASGPNELERIVQKFDDERAQTSCRPRHPISLEKSGEQAIVAASYDPNYGACPVGRYSESTVVTVLSRVLLSGELTSRSVVHIGATEGENDSYDDACNH
jgi:ATP-dependent Clp protease ATP-binding subunit ClpB